MNRRDFIRSTAILAAGTSVADYANARPLPVKEQETVADSQGKLIDSAPMLQNYAATSMGVAFSVTDMANGFVTYGEQSDLSDGKTVKCGGYRVTDMNDQVMLIRLTGLKPATKYYYRIGADRISYKGGYDMKIIGTETDPRIYSFTTAGPGAQSHFCVINDTHDNDEALDILVEKINKLKPSCVIWNGDASNSEETIDTQKKIFLKPQIRRTDYAAEIPYLFNPGNHDNRGLANRHLERVWMFRQPEERLSRDWDLGRNYAVRMGDIALIGLDTAEDKLDTNPIFAGLFTSKAYREAQTLWLEDALKRPEIASAPYLVAFCHIPLYSDVPRENPGDLAPDDSHPDYDANYAYWQRTCANMWTPLLQKAGCQVIITAHLHTFRYYAPSEDRKWAQITGGGNSLNPKNKETFPTVIDGFIENGELKIDVYNVRDEQIAGSYTYKPRKVKRRKK